MNTTPTTAATILEAVQGRAKGQTTAEVLEDIKDSVSITPDTCPADWAVGIQCGWLTLYTPLDGGRSTFLFSRVRDRCVIWLRPRRPVRTLLGLLWDRVKRVGEGAFICL